jgi:hypothetical protein
MYNFNVHASNLLLLYKTLKMSYGTEKCKAIILTQVFNKAQSTIQTIKSRRMRWAGHATCMGVVRNAYRILLK